MLVINLKNDINFQSFGAVYHGSERKYQLTENCIWNTGYGLFKHYLGWL